MKKKPRLKRTYSATERAELWQRWHRGETVSDISRALDRKPGTIHMTLALRGGVRPTARKRSEKNLSRREREQISRGLCSGISLRQIAREISRPPSTVSREVARNGGRQTYRALSADKRALKKALRPKVCKLAEEDRLRHVVAQKLERNWSPEQISGWLKTRYGDKTAMRISHESIYRSLYIQTRGVLKKELVKHLRQSRTMRKSKAAQDGRKNQGAIQDEISIADRPKSVDKRRVPGHWEGDLISGSKNTHVATLVERKSRFTLLVKVDGKDAASVHKALKKRIKKLPSEMRRSLTWDRGSELARHKELSIDANLKIYFCDPGSPWQRGTNENTNGLLRQYMPKKTDLSVYSQSDLNKISRELNERPRKTLEFKTPFEVYRQALR